MWTAGQELGRRIQGSITQEKTEESCEMRRGEKQLVSEGGGGRQGDSAAVLTQLISDDTGNLDCRHYNTSHNTTHNTTETSTVQCNTVIPTKLISSILFAQDSLISRLWLGRVKVKESRCEVFLEHGLSIVVTFLRSLQRTGP